MLLGFVVGIHLVSLTVLAALCVAVLVKLKNTKRELLVLCLFCAFLYVFGALLETVATMANGSIPSIWIMVLGGALASPTFLIFVQQYCECSLPKAVNYMLFGTAFLIILLVWGFEWHNLIHGSIHPHPEGGVSLGFLYFFALLVFHTVCTVFSLVLLFLRVQHADAIHKKRLGILIICAAIPGVSQVLDFLQFSIFGMYNAVLAIPLASGLGYFGLFKYDLLENEETIRSQNWLKDMIANISHDIKTPLTILSINIEKLLHISPDDPTYFRGIRVAHNKSLDLQRLIQNLIEVTRIEAAQNLYKPEWISLNAVLSDIQKKYGDHLESTGLYLDVAGCGDDVLIFADPIKIWSVFDNIIYNAVLHTKSGGISVMAELTGNTAIITVRDTGCGIPPEHLPHIFERFYTAGANKGGQRGKTGLGLFIVKSIMESFCGRIEIKSEVGVGTVVLLSFEKKEFEDA